MIVRIWLLAGVLLVALGWGLMVPLSPEPFQASTTSNIGGYRTVGLLPKPGDFVMSRDIGHEVFEIPETDAEHLAEIKAAGGGQAMEGMVMEEPKQEGEQTEQAMTGMAMDEPKQGGEHAEQPATGMVMDEAKEHGEEPMPGMATKEIEDEAKHAEQPATGMVMDEAKEHGEESMPGMAGHEAEEAGGHGGGGLMVMPAEMAQMAGRMVEIEMREWGFSPGRLTVKPGEVIRFRVHNRGEVPHEFMFMPPEGMGAVNYRLERADWNLTEHEAAYERAVVLPGDAFEVVIKVERAGTWMFMCMFPYHMQFGMMGVMMTEGAPAMDMGGMKM